MLAYEEKIASVRDDSNEQKTFMICRSLPLIFQCSGKMKPEYVVKARPVHDHKIH